MQDDAALREGGDRAGRRLGASARRATSAPRRCRRRRSPSGRSPSWRPRDREAAPGTASARERPLRRGSERPGRPRVGPASPRLRGASRRRRGGRDDAPASEWAGQDPAAALERSDARAFQKPHASPRARRHGQPVRERLPRLVAQKRRARRDRRRQLLRTRRDRSLRRCRHATPARPRRPRARARAPRFAVARPAADTRAGARDAAATPERRARDRGRAGRAGCHRPRHRAGATTARSPRSPRSSCRSGARVGRGRRGRRARSDGGTARRRGPPSGLLLGPPASCARDPLGPRRQCRAHPTPRSRRWGHLGFAPAAARAVAASQRRRRRAGRRIPRAPRRGRG